MQIGNLITEDMEEYMDTMDSTVSSPSTPKGTLWKDGNSDLTTLSGTKDGVFFSNSSFNINSTIYSSLIFLEHLPPLEYIRPMTRNNLPCKTRRTQRLTLVLDLDETLIYATNEKMKEADHVVNVKYDNHISPIYVSIRPYAKQFLETVSNYFEVVLFTASAVIHMRGMGFPNISPQREYGRSITKLLDPTNTLIKHKLYRDSCIEINGIYVKDASALGRDLSNVIIVDNSIHGFPYQLNNSILIKSYEGDKRDTGLLNLPSKDKSGNTYKGVGELFVKADKHLLMRE